jgi:hypothetical protein
MSSFPPLTEADLSRARTDPAFRQKLLQQSLDALLGRLQKERQMPSSVAAKPGQMREGVTLAVRFGGAHTDVGAYAGKLIRLRFRAGRV